MMQVAFLLAWLAGSVSEATPLAEPKWAYQQPKRFDDWLGALATRVVLDVVAIPASVVGWDAVDYTLFATGALLSTAPLVPVGGRSLDARLQDWLHQQRGANCGYTTRISQVCPVLVSPGFRLWTSEGDPIIIATLLTVPLFVLGAGAIAHQTGQVEAGTLAIEAVLVTQVYHLTLKVLSGREGPLWYNGSGSFHGPTVRYMPDGYPSGHAAFLFAVASVYSTYFDEPWLSALLFSTATALSVFLVLDDSHYLSEVIMGAATGYFVGRWVVNHRSSRTAGRVAADRGLQLRSVGVVPGVGGASLAASFSW